MNIFYVAHSPRECARMHVDRHVVKMITEYSQLLSTAHRVLDGNEYADVQGLYRATHKNHPSAKWVRQSNANYDWLYGLLVELHAEYTHRYGKVHASQRILSALKVVPINIPNDPFTQPPQAMPDYCKRVDAIEAYRVYYIQEKNHLASWKKRDVPEWYRENVYELTETFSTSG